MMGGTGVGPTRDAQVKLCVLGWTASESDLNADVAEAIARYVRAALLAGLGPDEIQDDVASRWAGRFGEVSVDVTRSLLTYRAHVFAVALPAPLPVPRPLLASEQA